ncbi:MAG: hypothetical protein Q9164_005076 [Protoblastenia rupestris]
MTNIVDSFLKMISGGTGGSVINYSDRFTLSGMTGTFPPAVEAGIKEVKDTSGPQAQNNINDNANANGAAGGGGGSGQPYSMQTGATRYAPMQRKPGTKITARAATPLYPTSSAKIAKTFLPTPKQVTTMTMSVTWTASSVENSGTPVPGPGADMQKFLNRWRD